jgi:hypothetical protein
MVLLAGVGTPFNGYQTIETIPTPTSFTFDLTAPDVAQVASSGTVSAPGIVSYSWVTADTSTAGEYLGTVVVTFPGGAVQSFPSGADAYIPIAVTEALPAAHGLSAGPCLPWTTPDAVRACVGGIAADSDLGMWIDAASQILYALTGRQYKGLCTAKIRPAHSECSCGFGCGAHAWGWPFSGAFGFGPFGLPGWGYGWGWGSGEGAQSILLCASEIDLGQDAREVLSVTINGVAVDPATYRLDPRGKLVRQPDANGNRLIWPCCSRLDVPSGAVGSFEIVYSYGQAPPDSVVMACNILAGQLALGCNPGTAGMCKLPSHLQTMTRLGVTATFVTDTTVFLAKGFTGLPLVDLVIQSVNPGHASRRARVVSPDVIPHRLLQ